MKKRFQFPEKPNGDNAVEVAAFYRKAGVNLYNGKHEGSGFYISFQPGCLSSGSYGSSFSCMMFGGFKVKVAEGSRDNKKKCQALLDRVTEEVAKLAFDEEEHAAYLKLKEIFK